MKAWEIRNGDLGLHDVGSAQPREGETVVRVSHVGICGSDLPKLRLPNGFALPEPWRPGHEIVGTDPTGRSVAVDPLVPCGTCPRCATGDIHLCAGLRRIGWDVPGGFAEQVVVPAENAHPLPNGADPLHAALADPAAVAIHGLRCNPIASPGHLAVFGAGTVGLLTALYAHQQGWRVTIVHRDGRPPFDAVAKAVPAAFRSPAALYPQQTFDVVVDAATGADPAPLDLALRLVGDGGTIIVQNAYHPGVHLPTPLRDLFRRSIRLIGSFSYCRRRSDDFALALDMLRSHAAQVAHLVASVGELADLPTVLGGQWTRSIRHVLTVHAS
ncbi:zinc-dependent alcohol dehydrogenase [Amycolatopsis nalaikhensis]|uniref:Alcohol dehydrogenase catalytic domain-containing protein n=1 Tax=Amycolatopsis nalaikhensis TaxID=715472 RepID=A0ABY8XYT4_9PSEU|nr:alcohol dehydrogenase catalytic domain-containing protein [Amycolatopsis sp. 2-2]WIV60779.1 alcohol dehydrogenase catalytic domain-containing protein [Amycolatopsis sp. 2-2]